MMEERFLLWLYLISAGWTLVLWGRRRALFAPRFAVCVLVIGAVSALGLASPEWQGPAFVVATVGFLGVLLLPGLLVRLARAAARRGRFPIAIRLLAAARLLLPASFLKEEEELYRRVRSGPGAAMVRQRLAAMNRDEGGEARLPAARLLVAAFLAMFAACLVTGGWTGPSSLLTLVELGANESSRVADGEWFRLFTAMFLHVGLLHLSMNVIAVLVVGRWVEPSIGPWRTLVVFLLGGLIGNLASMAIYGGGPEPYVSAGASGGAMALIGASLVVSLRAPPSPLRARRVQSLVLIVGATVFLGLVEEGIDNGAHIGGLLAGAVLALFLTGRRRLPSRVVRSVALLLIAAALTSIAWMLTTLPSWEETCEFRGDGYSFRGPAVLERAGEGWSAGVLGAMEIETVALDTPPAERLARELSVLVAEARSLPGTENVTAARAESVGPWLAGVVRVDGPLERLPAWIYLRPDPSGTRAGIVRVHPGDDDPRLRELLTNALLETFRFE